MSTPLSAAQQIARAADGLSASFADQLAAVLRETERGLRPVIEQAAAGSAIAVVRAARATRARRAIRDVLRGAGFDALVDLATGAVLDGLVDDVLAGRAGLANDLTTPPVVAIEALKALFATNLLDEADSVATALWQATIRGVFAARPVGAILRDLQDVLDASEPQVRTLYDTSVSIFGRQVEAIQAGDEPQTVFVYMGPADKKTRPFCREHVGKVYTRKEIDALDNGQLDNVFLTGGGYNCRHVWQEVSQFSELRNYVGTGKRVPEVQDQLDRLAPLPTKKAA